MPPSEVLCIGGHARPLPGTYRVLDESPSAAPGLSLLKLTANAKRFGCRKIRKSSEQSRIDSLYEGVKNHVRLSSHPYVLEAYEAYEDEDFVYIITETCEDTTLSLFRGEHVPEDKIAKWGLQVVHALAHCHHHGVVHCRIDPDNILVLQDSDRIKFTGFEASQTANKDKYLTQRLESTVYSAPEICECRYTMAVDVYSLGSTQCWLLSGQTPCPKAKNAEPWRTTSAAAQRMVQRLCAVMPGHRPRARHLVKDIWLNGQAGSGVDPRPRNQHDSGHLTAKTAKKRSAGPSSRPSPPAKRRRTQQAEAPLTSKRHRQATNGSAPQVGLAVYDEEEELPGGSKVRAGRHCCTMPQLSEGQDLQSKAEVRSQDEAEPLQGGSLVAEECSHSLPQSSEHCPSEIEEGELAADDAGCSSAPGNGLTATAPTKTVPQIDSITGQSRNRGSGTLAKAHGSRSYSASNTTARLHVPGHYTSGNTMQQHSGRSGMAPPASRSRTNHGRHGAHCQRERRTAKHTQPTGGMSLPEDPISLGHALEYIPHAALIGKVSSECVACKGRQDNGLMPGDAPHKVADELKNYAGHRSKHAGSYYRQVHTSQQRILTQWWSEVLCVLELCHRHGATTWKDNAWTSPDGCVITHTTDLAALYNITVRQPNQNLIYIWVLCSTSPRRTKSFYDFALDRLQFARTNGSNYEVFVLRTGYTDQDRHGQAGPLLVRYADVFGLSKGSTITSFLGLNDRDAADLRRDLDVPDTDSEWEARKAWEDKGHHYLGSLDQSQLLDEEHCRHLHKPN